MPHHASVIERPVRKAPPDAQLDQAAANSIFQLPGNDGIYAPSQRDYLQALGRRRPSVFLVFPPKAAGTFLREAVITATGGELVRVVHAQGGRDAQLYYPTLLAYFLGGVCHGPLTTHVHMQALPANVAMMQALGLKPIVMIRNIPDMLASYWDMLDREPSALDAGLNCVFPSDWSAMPSDDKADFLVDMLGPWYAGYYATWLAQARKDGDVCVLRYGELLDDAAGCLETILRHSGFPTSRPYCELLMLDLWDERGNFRFNQGREGRGKDYFQDHHRDRLARMLSLYRVAPPDIAELV